MWRLFLYTTNKYDDDNNKGHDKVQIINFSYKGTTTMGVIMGRTMGFLQMDTYVVWIDDKYHPDIHKFTFLCVNISYCWDLSRSFSLWTVWTHDP